TGGEQRGEILADRGDAGEGPVDQHDIVVAVRRSSQENIPAKGIEMREGAGKTVQHGEGRLAGIPEAGVAVEHLGTVDVADIRMVRLSRDALQRRSGGLDPLAEPLVAQGGVLWEGRVVEVSAVELPETPGHERVVVRRFGVPGGTGGVPRRAPGGAAVALRPAVPRRGSDAAGTGGEQAGAVELDLAVRPVDRGRRGVRLRQGPSLEDDGRGFGGAVCD